MRIPMQTRITTSIEAMLNQISLRESKDRDFMQRLWVALFTRVTLELLRCDIEPIYLLHEAKRQFDTERITTAAASKIKSSK